MARPESWYKRRTAAGVRLPAPHYFKLKINNQKLRAMIKVTVKINTDEKKYVTSSTIECRLFGILLYRKVYYYPEEGWRGEYTTR